MVRVHDGSAGLAGRHAKCSAAPTTLSWPGSPARALVMGNALREGTGRRWAGSCLPGRSLLRPPCHRGTVVERVYAAWFESDEHRDHPPARSRSRDVHRTTPARLPVRRSSRCSRSQALSSTSHSLAAPCERIEAPDHRMGHATRCADLVIDHIEPLPVERAPLDRAAPPPASPRHALCSSSSALSIRPDASHRTERR